jgi:anaerobic ribonucleoside-triphosphate reductase activating protein
MGARVSAPSGMLQVGRVAERCEVLGPGRRAVVWVAGCPLRCRECVVPELLDPAAGEPVAVAELSERLLALPQLDGVTFSGGEPFAQAEALLELTRRLRARRPQLSLMSYSGYPLSWLRKHGTPAQLALLDRLDVLVDGPYLPERHAPLRWRGSSNQCIRLLSDRHAELAQAADEPAGIELELDTGGRFAWAGVPPRRGWRHELERRLAEQGVLLEAAATPEEAR